MNDRIRRPPAASLATALLALCLSSCVQRPQPQTAAAVPAPALGERVFKAVLFPYIPDSVGDDFAGLKSKLEAWFEAANPEIDLKIVIDSDMNLYDLSSNGTVATLLGTGPGAANVVELDTILLGDLVDMGWVQPLPFSISGLDLYPASVSSATVGSTVYGVPTYLCGNYIYSWEEGIRQVSTGKGLISFLENLDPSVTPLVGNFKGSWTLPSLYVDAWADTFTNDPSQVAASYELPLDQTTMSVFQGVVNLCGDKGGKCLDGTFKDNTAAETLFAQNKANGFVGYSERLFYILKARDGNLALPYVISAPLGVGSNPVMFVDALMMNPACTGQCAADAEAFSKFMSSLKVRNLIAFSQDGTDLTLPRYLLQALRTFYTTPPGSENLIYQQIRPILDGDRQYPNRGFPKARLKLNLALTKALTGADVLEQAERPVGQVIDGVEILHAPARFPSPDLLGPSSGDPRD